MAHIATCMAAVEPTSITKPASPARAMFSSSSPPKHSAKSFASLKAAQAEQPQRYQLFPKDKPLPAPATLNTSKALPIPQVAESNGRTSPLAGIRIRLNQNNLVRRRKVSVPELGPMTTVQEVSMDSPTIPGRPPLHERSSSAPEESSRLVGPLDQILKAAVQPGNLTRVINEAFEIPAPKPRSVSPRKLAPLVIPPTDGPAPRLQSKHSSTQLRSGSTPPSEYPRAARAETGTPTLGRLTPASTPDLSIPRSATATEATASTLATPVSAPLTGSPPTYQEGGNPLGHRRAGSESSSVMDRGRPSKRNEKTSKTKSSERRAFEELPIGWRPCEAMGKLNANDYMALHKQALGQAERFEVLKVEDVEALSKELRQLDDRTEYLRRTYSSLRAGRRNLHSRICQYLRSPRVAKFSYESMLKQEEALAELDASIDDWVTKLEQAENRRTRVRQKLLEHVAAAAILAVPDSCGLVAAASSPHGASCVAVRDMSTPPRSPTKLQSPARASPSPQRVVAQVPSAMLLEQPTPVVVVAAAAAAGPQQPAVSRSASSATIKSRKAVESIRVYAGDELYALLADVEDEIGRLGTSPEESIPLLPGPPKEQARKRSQERLHGDAASPPSPPPTATPPPPPVVVVDGAGSSAAAPPRAPKKDFLKEAQTLLTNAVFRP